MKSGIQRTAITCLLAMVALYPATYAEPGDGDAGGLEIAASDKGGALPGAIVRIFSNDKPVTDEATDRTALALFPLGEGEYAVVVEAAGKTVRDTIIVKPGEFKSFTADTSRSSFDENDEPILTYVPIDGAHTEKDYTVQMADLDGVISIKMGTPRGTIFVSIPYDAEVGQTVSWSAVLQPSGGSQKDREKNESKLRDHYLVIADGQFPLKENPVATFVVSPTLEIGLTEGKKKEKIKTSVPLYSTASESGDIDPGMPTGGFSMSCDGPIEAFSGWPVRIPGVFDGRIANTDVTVGGKPVRVEAETGSGVIISTPAWSLGLTTVQVSEGESRADCPLRNVGIALSADKLDLQSGETTTMHLKVQGLEGIERPRYVALVNRSSGVISMSEGNSQLLTIYPADVSESGEYNQDRILTGRRRGSFTIDAVLNNP